MKIRNLEANTTYHYKPYIIYDGNFINKEINNLSNIIKEEDKTFYGMLSKFKTEEIGEEESENKEYKYTIIGLYLLRGDAIGYLITTVEGPILYYENNDVEEGWLHVPWNEKIDNGNGYNMTELIQLTEEYIDINFYDVSESDIFKTTLRCFRVYDNVLSEYIQDFINRTAPISVYE